MPKEVLFPISFATAITHSIELFILLLDRFL